MKYLIVFLLPFLMYNTSYAQAGHFKNVSSNIDSLNNAASNIFLTFPDSAHKIAAKALILSEKSNYAFGKGRSFLNLGTIYWSQSYYPVSLFYLKSAVANLPKDKRLYLSEAYRALGRTYADLKEFKQAFKDLDTALYLAGNDVEKVAEVYNEQSYVYYHLKNYNKAIELARYSLKLDRAINVESSIGILYGRLSSIYINEGKYKAALADVDTAYTMSLKTHNRRLRAYVYIDYATIDNKLREFPNAIDYARMAIALADSVGVIDAETRAYDALVNTYELKHDLLKALGYQRKYAVAKDSLNRLNRLKTITLVQNYYDLNWKLKGVALMRADNRINKARIRSQDTIIATLVLSVVVLMVILSATYYFYKQKKILSTKLQQQHKDLLDQKQLIEVQAVNLQTVNNLKDKLLAVIGHDLRTPVANLSNIIELFETGYLTTAEVHGLMKNINPVVKGAELTLINLVEWAGSQIKGQHVNSSNVAIFLLGVEIGQTFIHALQQKNIDFINNGYPGQDVVADENHIKVVLRNLVSNAIKFTGDNGQIILATIIEGDDLVISIEDNGKGMSDEEIKKLFYLDTHFSNSGTSGEKGTGLGLILCKELVELNGGTLKVKSIEGKGTVFYFNLPLAKSYA